MALFPNLKVTEIAMRSCFKQGLSAQKIYCSECSLHPKLSL